MRNSAGSPLFPYTVQRVPHRSETWCKYISTFFFFPTMICGVWRKQRFTPKEIWHEDCLLPGSWQAQGTVAELCWALPSLWRSPQSSFTVSADKIQTTKVFRIRFFLPSSSKGWFVPSFKSSSTHGRDGCLLLVSRFSFSPSVFFIITPIKTHIMAINTGVREEKSAITMEMWSLSSKFSSFSWKGEAEGQRAGKQ